MQRLRIKFGRGEELKFISHLDLMRLWERALRRADIGLAYTEGFTPHPRLSLAAPLQVGMISEAELLDIYLNGWISPLKFREHIKKSLPKGIDVIEVNIVSLEEPALQAQVRSAEYLCLIESKRNPDEVLKSIQDILNSSSLPWSHMREKNKKEYDLRKLIDEIKLISYEDGIYSISMKLRCDNTGTGRPEQVLLALDFSELPLCIKRVKLLF